MADVTIKNVPSGSEELVKETAMIAIERFIRDRDCQIAANTVAKFKTDIDTIREVNGLSKKYEEARV